MRKVQVDYHPKILREARLIKIDKHGDFIFTTDLGMWCIDPKRLSGINSRDINLIGTLTRYTANKEDKYKWIEDIKEQEEQQTNNIKHTKSANKAPQKELSRGLTIGKLAKRFFKGV